VWAIGDQLLQERWRQERRRKRKALGWSWRRAGALGVWRQERWRQER
jgi:hypothetical protein